MGELTFGLGVALDLVWSFWGGAGDELAEDEAIWRENGAGDEARGLPDSISVKHNLVNTRYKRKNKEKNLLMANIPLWLL